MRCATAGFPLDSKAAHERPRDQRGSGASATGAPVIVTANPGCLLQMRAGAKIHSTGQEVVHVMELLDRALPKNI